MKRLFLAVAALAALVSCNRGNELVPSQNFRNVSIVAKSAETKTVLQDNAVVWQASDAIKVRFDKTDVSPSTSHFETFTTAQGGETATFAGTLPNDVSQTGGYDATGYAVYPATAMDDNGTVSFTLPSEVTVDADGTFSASENLSSAKVSLTDLVNGGTTSANFLNAFSIIRFTLDPDVETLKLTANNPLAGAAVMEFDDNGRLVVNSFTSGGKELTISAPEGGFVENAMYNVLVFPGTFTWLKAQMTDTDDCTFEKTVDNLTFAAANFYKFNFTNPDNFDKTYSFTATGRTFAADDEIQVVVPETSAADAVLKYVDGKFTGKTTHANYEADKPGYALYPASAYNLGYISYNLPADGTQPTDELYAAPFSLKDESVTFTSVTSSLAQLSFTVPTGVKSVKIASNKGIVGTASMTVTDGVLVAGAGDGMEINVTGGTEYTLYVYPVDAATLIVTLTDAADAKTTLDAQNVSLTKGNVTTLTINGAEFDKGGNFTHEGFVDGNGNDEAIVF